mgnify:CR=1 FL=1
MPVRSKSILRAPISWSKRPALLLLPYIIISGCPTFDPYTQSHISNNTDDTIGIELVLDTNQWRAGFEPGEFEEWLAERSDAWVLEQLQVYADRGQGVEMLAVEPNELAGTYQIAPGGYMVIDASMGTKTTIRFSRLKLIKGKQPCEFSDRQAIFDLFQPVKNQDGLYEFSVIDDLRCSPVN